MFAFFFFIDDSIETDPMEIGWELYAHTWIYIARTLCNCYCHIYVRMTRSLWFIAQITLLCISLLKGLTNQRRHQFRSHQSMELSFLRYLFLSHKSSLHIIPPHTVFEFDGFTQTIYTPLPHPWKHHTIHPKQKYWHFPPAIRCYCLRYSLFLIHTLIHTHQNKNPSFIPNCICLQPFRSGRSRDLLLTSIQKSEKYSAENTDVLTLQSYVQWSNLGCFFIPIIYFIWIWVWKRFGHMFPVLFDDLLNNLHGWSA